MLKVKKIKLENPDYEIRILQFRRGKRKCFEVQLDDLFSGETILIDKGEGKPKDNSIYIGTAVKNIAKLQQLGTHDLYKLSIG